MYSSFFKKYRKYSKFFLTGFLLLLMIETLGAGSMKMGKGEIQVTGRVYVMGNEPFTQVAVQLDNGKVYALIGQYDKAFRSLQGKRITVRGRLSGKTTRGTEAIEVKSFQVLEEK